MLVITTRYCKVKDKLDILKNKAYKSTHSIRFAMITTYVAVTLIALILMSAYNVGILSENLYQEETMRLYAKANIISQSMTSAWNVADEREMIWRGQDVTGRILGGTNIRGVITDNSYTVLYDTNSDTDMVGKVFMRDVLKRALDGEQAQSEFEADTGKTLTVSVPIEVNDEIVGGVYLAENVSSTADTINAIKTSLILFSVLLLFIIVIISIGTSYIITRPITHFISVAKAISKGDFSKRARVDGMREMAEMGQALNFMCDQLNQLEEKRKNFVSDVSHELKTPMAGIKLLCDSLVQAENPDMDTIREFLNDMSEEIDRLTRIINRLLTLSRLDAGRDLAMSDVDISALCNGVVESVRKLAAEKAIELQYIPPEMPTILVCADYDKIYECVYNIVVNAINYTPEYGHVEARVSFGDGKCIIAVEDDGPGIPDEEKQKIFERFYRLDDSRARDTGGTGLGLAITKEAVLLHNGTIEVTDSQTGGSIFTITLPVPELGKE